MMSTKKSWLQAARKHINDLLDELILLEERHVWELKAQGFGPQTIQRAEDRLKQLKLHRKPKAKAATR